MRRWSLRTMMIGLVAASLVSVAAVWIWRDRDERHREAVQRTREWYAELVHLDEHGGYDNALALATQVLREARACGEGNIMRSAERIHARLQRQYDEITRRISEARQLADRGDHSGAQRMIDSLRADHPLWQAAQTAQLSGR